MTDISPIAMYDKSDAFIAMLSPVSCVLRETLNGEDKVTMRCVYDADGVWKTIKPGNRIRVRTARAAVPSSDVFRKRQEYYVDNSAGYSDREYYTKSASGVYTLAGHAMKNKGIIDHEYDKTTERYNCDLVSDTGESVDDVWLCGKCVSIRTRTEIGKDVDSGDVGDDIEAVSNDAESNAASNAGSYTTECFTIQTVELSDSAIVAEAVHETIDIYSSFIVCGRDYYGYSRCLETGKILDDFKRSTTDTTETYCQYIDSDKKALSRIKDEMVFSENIICSYEELISTKLRDVFDYDILRRGGRAYLCDYVGSKTPVAVLMVSVNLAALTVVYDRTESDLSGALAYIKEEDKIDCYMRGTKSPTATTRYTFFADETAQAMYDGGDTAMALKHMRLYAEDKNSAKRGTDEFKCTVTPEIAQNGALDGTMLVLGDVVEIRDPRLVHDGGSVKRRIVSRTQDCLTGRVTGITVGDLPESLYDAIKKMR